MATRFNVFHIINSFLVICFSIRLVLGLCYFQGAAAPFFVPTIFVTPGK